MQVPISEGKGPVLMMDIKHKSSGKKALIAAGDEAVQFGGTGFVDRSVQEKLKAGTEIMGSMLKESGAWTSESLKSRTSCGGVVHDAKERSEQKPGKINAERSNGPMATGKVDENTEVALKANDDVATMQISSQGAAVIPTHKVKPMISEDSKSYLKMLLNSKNREFIHIYDEKLRAFTQPKNNSRK